MKARTALAAIDARAALREATTLLEEMKTLHRRGEWNAALYQYSRARKLIAIVRSSVDRWAEEDLKVFTATSGLLARIERQVESQVQKGGESTLKPEKLNSALAVQIDLLTAIEAKMRLQNTSEAR
ncbi:MAG: hypothetical protein ACRCT8_09635 [Lacipirellulaceae bacterium]